MEPYFSAGIADHLVDKCGVIPCLPKEFYNFNESIDSKNVYSKHAMRRHIGNKVEFDLDQILRCSKIPRKIITPFLGNVNAEWYAKNETIENQDRMLLIRAFNSFPFEKPFF